MEQDPVERLRALCAGIGFDLDRLDGSLLDRVRLLAEHSNVLDDAARMAGYAARVFRHYDAELARLVAAVDRSLAAAPP